MKTTTKQFLSILGLMVAVIVWGSTFILVKWTVAELDVYYFLFVRFSLALLVLAVMFRKRVFPVKKETLKASFYLGLLLAISYISQTEGLRFTSATNSGMITGLYLVFIPIFSALFFKERAHLTSVIGVAISISGLFFLTQYSFHGINVGDYLTLICALGWAWHIILTGRYAGKHDTIALVLYQFFFSIIIFGAVTLFRGSYTTDISQIAWITIIVTALFASAFALVIQVVAQRFIDPTRVGIIFALEAVFAAIFGYLIGDEMLTRAAFFGACLMVVGMIVSEIRPLAKRMVDPILGYVGGRRAKRS